MDSKKVGLFIVKLRKNQRLTQNELADIIGVTDSAISRWERGEGFPEITIIPKLANLFNITTDELLNGDYIKKSENRKSAFVARFNMYFTLAILIIFIGYLLGIILQLATYLTWALAVFGLTSLVAAISMYLVMRVRFIEKSDLNELDKKCLVRNDKIVTSFFILTILLILPLYIVDARLIFSSYFLIVLLVNIFFIPLYFTVFLLIDKHYYKRIEKRYISQIIASSMTSFLFLIVISTFLPRISYTFYISIQISISLLLICLSITGLILKKTNVLNLILITIFSIFSLDFGTSELKYIVCFLSFLNIIINFFYYLKRKKVYSLNILHAHNMFLAITYLLLSTTSNYYEILYIITFSLISLSNIIFLNYRSKKLSKSSI